MVAMLCYITAAFLIGAIGGYCVGDIGGFNRGIKTALKSFQEELDKRARSGDYK